MSVTVAAEAASGGFVVPNDHVDVVLTRNSDGNQQMSQTILHNVRVLAINTRLGPTTPRPARAGTGAGSAPENPDVFSNSAIATLELDPNQAEVIINATTARPPLADAAPPSTTVPPRPSARSEADRASTPPSVSPVRSGPSTDQTTKLTAGRYHGP